MFSSAKNRVDSKWKHIASRQGSLNSVVTAFRLTCFLFDFAENAEERGFHSVTVQSMFPLSVKKKKNAC